jgi:hypothetical protein
VGTEIFCWLVKVTPDGCIDTIFCQSSDVVTVEPEKTTIKIYPNPASSRVFVSFAENIGPVEAIIYASDGRVILQTTLSGSGDVLLQDWAPGIYWMRVVTENGEHHYRTLMIQRP